MTKIAEEIKEGEKNQAKLSDLINCKPTFRALIISFGLMLFQQLSGVNAVLFYTNTIFEESGGSLSPGTCSILIGLVQVRCVGHCIHKKSFAIKFQVISTLCSTLLIDRAGRKILLILSDSVMCVSLAILGVYFYAKDFINLSSYTYVPLVSLAMYIIFFSIGFGPIPWMIMGELFHPKDKGTASSLSASLNWLLAFLVTNQFANLISLIGIGLAFIVFSIICGLGTIFVVVLVPETKGKTIEEVIDILAEKPKTITEKNGNVTTSV